jgi:hypothetical protein
LSDATSSCGDCSARFQNSGCHTGACGGNGDSSQQFLFSIALRNNQPLRIPHALRAGHLPAFPSDLPLPPCGRRGRPSQAGNTGHHGLHPPAQGLPGGTPHACFGPWRRYHGAQRRQKMTFPAVGVAVVPWSGLCPGGARCPVGAEPWVGDVVAGVLAAGPVRAGVRARRGLQARGGPARGRGRRQRSVPAAEATAASATGAAGAGATERGAGRPVPRADYSPRYLRTITCVNCPQRL